VDGDQHRLGGLYATPVGWQIFHGSSGRNL